MNNDELAKQVYRVFSPDPPSEEEIDKYYVDLDTVRGHVSVVNRLARAIELSAPDIPVCQLLAGHRGCGKSTELIRLKRTLEEDQKYFVVLVPAENGIDFNDVDFPELLLVIIRELASSLKDRLKIDLKPGYFKDRLERLRDLLGAPIEFDTAGLKAGLFEISTKIKQSPGVRKQIRQALEPESANLINAANDLIGEASLKASNRGFGGLVILVDDVDKIVMRQHESGVSTGEYLFINREPQISSFQCHMVYTIPLALAYSNRGATIANLYGGELPVTPMIKIRSRPPNTDIDADGRQKMEEIVRRRLEIVGTSIDSIFTNNVLTNVIEFSGGQPREFMHLIRKAIVSHGVPITEDGLHRAITESQRAYRRQLMEEHWELIERIRENGVLPRTQDNDAELRDLLDSRAILQYINDEEWYAPNPLLPHRE